MILWSCKWCQHKIERTKFHWFKKKIMETKAGLRQTSELIIDKTAPSVSQLAVNKLSTTILYQTKIQFTIKYIKQCNNNIPHTMSMMIMNIIIFNVLKIIIVINKTRIRQPTHVRAMDNFKWIRMYTMSKSIKQKKINKTDSDSHKIVAIKIKPWRSLNGSTISKLEFVYIFKINY